MACERHTGALSDLAAGAPAAVELEEHLGSCAGCQSELQVLRQALAAADGELARLRFERPSPDLEARIRAAVADSQVAPSRGFAWAWRPALAAAVALLVGVVVVARVPPRGAPVAIATPSTGRPVRLPPVTDSTQVKGAADVPPRNARAASAAARTAPPPTRPAAGARRPEPSAAEVLVPPEEAEALLRFVAGLRRRAVAPESLLVADLTAPLVEPGSVDIRPLEIVPLDPVRESGAE